MKNEKIKLESEEVSEVKNFIIIISILTGIILVVFLFTKYVINDGDVRITVFDSITGSVNYNYASVGTMLGKADEEYYVFAYDRTDQSNVIYQVLESNYKTNEGEDALAVYFVDTDNMFNKDYLASNEEGVNTEAKSIDDLVLGAVTLIKVKNGKIVKYLTQLEEIKEELK